LNVKNIYATFQAQQAVSHSVFVAKIFKNFH